MVSNLGTVFEPSPLVKVVDSLAAHDEAPGSDMNLINSSVPQKLFISSQQS